MTGCASRRSLFGRIGWALPVGTVSVLVILLAGCGTNNTTGTGSSGATAGGPGTSSTPDSATGAATITTASSAPTDPLDVSIQAMVDAWRTQHNAPGIAVGLVRPAASGAGPQVNYYVSGLANLKTNAPVTPQTVFEVGSVSKAFTGDLLAQLVRLGKVSLDDPLQKYAPPGVTVPTFAGAPNVPITLRDLATHESGLPDEPTNISINCKDPKVQCDRTFEDYTRDQMWQGLTQTKLLWQPGTKWLYSNFAFGILGTILADLIQPGQPIPPYNTVLQSQVLGNFPMPATHLAERHQPLADGYIVTTSSGAVQTKADPEQFDNNSQSGEGGMASDITDMSTWAAGHLDYPVGETPDANQPLLDSLQPASTATTLCYDNNKNKIVCNAGTQQMGLAWQLDPADSTIPAPYATKNGAIGGFLTEVFLVPTKKVGVVVLTNLNGVDPGTLGTAIVTAVLQQM